MQKKLEDLIRMMGGDEDMPNTDKLRDAELARKDLEKAVTVAFNDLLDSKMKVSTGKTVQLFDEEETVKGVAIYEISPTEKDWTKIFTDAFNAVYYKGSYLYNVMEYYAEMDSHLDVDDWKDEVLEEIEELAEELADEEIKIEVVMKGNTIIRQRLFNEEGQAGYELLTSGKETRFLLYYGADDKITPVVEFTSTKSGKTVEFETVIYTGYDKYRLSGSDVNLNKLSPLGVPMGEYSMSISGYKITLNVAAEGKGVNHELRLKISDSYMSRYLDSVSVVLYTEKGASINKPKGVETVDIGDYSEKELNKLWNKLGEGFAEYFGEVFDY